MTTVDSNRELKRYRDTDPEVWFVFVPHIKRRTVSTAWKSPETLQHLFFNIYILKPADINGSRGGELG